MRILPSLVCVSLVSFLCACSQNGYYDANGNYIAPPNATTEAQRTHSPSPGYSSDNYSNNSDRYDRRGYYDYNGYYIASNSGLSVPEDMFPPRGMCRVWFPDRDLANEPRVESCDGIRSRVPAGAYVIYGG